MYTNGGGLPYKRGKDGDFIFQNPVTELAGKITGKIYAAITAREENSGVDPSLESPTVPNR
jgi:hypothetical protein